MSQNDHREQLQSSIAKALLYSDIFSYPLTAEEVFMRLPTNHTCVEEVKEVLQVMISKGIVFKLGDFFAVRNEKDLEARRKTGNALAVSIMPKALKRGRLLSMFPFVRSVMISGSLSKNYMDKDSDVDYFVITAPGRLWIARFFVAAFKRIFLLNSRKLFCVNYYIDSEHLEIEEKNIFTATELVTLIPVTSDGSHSRLIQSNSWIHDFFPNHTRKDAGISSRAALPWLKRLVEAVIEPAADAVDSYILRIAQRRYQKRYASQYTPADFEIAFKSRKGVSKNHGQHFQKHVTELFDQKFERFQQDHRQSLVA